MKTKGFTAFNITQFLGAFNDNVFKLVIIMTAMAIFKDTESKSLFTSIAGAVFIAPFILLAPLAGKAVDRLGAVKVIRISKAAEVLIMAVSFIAFKLNDPKLMCIILFLMAAQSTLFSPAKYTLIPEITASEDLAKANGFAQMWTFLAIITGTSISGFFVNGETNSPAVLCIFFTTIALIGFITSLLIPQSQTKQKQVKKDSFKNTILSIKNNNALKTNIIMINTFWFLGSIFQMNGLLYLKESLHFPDKSCGLLLGAVCLGISLGSPLAGQITKRSNCNRATLTALTLTGLTCILLTFTSGIFTCGIALFLMGFFAAFYIAPLNTQYQQQTPKTKRGTFMAALNIMNAIAGIAASIFIATLSNIFKTTPAQIFTLTGAGLICMSIYFACKNFENTLRTLNRIIMKTIYKIKAKDAFNIPQHGGALLVCNHASYVDPPLLAAVINRPVRFLMFRELYENRLLHPFAKASGAIPIANSDSPKQIIESIRTARNAIKNGELVCIFPEGGLTRTGNLLPFTRGYEKIMKGIDAPIIPISITGIWGSIFSFFGGRYFTKRPRCIPFPVTISFGTPLPPETKAFKLRQTVQELYADAFSEYNHNRTLLHHAFIDQAKKAPFKKCIADSSKLNLNYIQTLSAMIMISRRLKTDQSSKKCGILLPSSCAAAIANGAALFAGQVPVNLNFTLDEKSLSSIIEQCKMNTIISSRRFVEKSGINLNRQFIFIEDMFKTISKTEKIATGIAAFILPKGLIKKLFTNDCSKDINQTATIIFSSGSTGEPKGAMLSHKNIFANIESLTQIMKINKNDCVLGSLPFFHSFGFTATLCFPLGTGISAVYHHTPTDAKTIGRLTCRHKATLLMGTPTFLSIYTKKCSPAQFSTLRHVAVGAEKLKQKQSDDFFNKFNLRAHEGYGATELSPIAAMGIPDYEDNKSRIHQPGCKTKSVGQPLPGIAAKITDPETGDTKGTDETGLLFIKGANVMKGYFRNEAATKEALKNQWYNTGDLAKIDKDGFIHILDRISRFSKIGGEMVPHIKIEEEIQNLIDTDNAACAVSSIEDKTRGEALAVLYTGNPNISKIRKQLQEKGMPALWIPKEQNFFKVTDIPVLGTGKSDLKKIKDTARSFANKKGVLI